MLPLLIALSQQPEFGSSEIHIDERCRVFTQDRPSAGTPYGKPGFHDGSALCHLRSDNHSNHWEEAVHNGVVSRTRVQIHERNYLLFNPTDVRVAFVLDISLPDGWTIDSDPRPTEVIDHLASFRVYARPGETLKLHIGERK